MVITKTLLSPGGNDDDEGTEMAVRGQNHSKEGDDDDDGDDDDGDDADDNVDYDDGEDDNYDNGYGPMMQTLIKILMMATMTTIVATTMMATDAHGPKCWRR